MQAANWQEPLTSLKGIGPQKYKRFQNMGVKVIADLITHYPLRYEDRSERRYLAGTTDGDKGLFQALVLSVNSSRIKGSQTMIKIQVDDGTHQATLVFMNVPFIAQQFSRGKTYWIYGSVQKKGRSISLFHPEFRDLEQYPLGFGIVPIYPLTDGLSQGEVSKAIAASRPLMAEGTETLPSICFSSGEKPMMNLAQALQMIHFPKSLDALKAARYRIIYEEFFHLQMALMLIKEKVGHLPKRQVYQSVQEEEVAKLFPFILTDAQNHVIRSIYDDMDRETCMNRLLQGDVGSGKTAVAMAAAYKCAISGYQVAILAPTEILAKQHAINFEKILGQYFEIVLLTGSSLAKDKKNLRESIENGKSQIIIGTHALIQEAVTFKSLKLVVTDEQHRFGVGQRQLAADKGGEPLDVLVMSATPIPRTLSLILYGDVEMSIIDQSPVGRKPIETFAVKTNKTGKMIAFIKERLALGEQAYIVAPLIETSENLDLQSVEALFESLTPHFEDHGLEVLHGQLKPKEKDAVMTRFKSGETKVIIATTVIEVGVDVGNATIMVIMHAERFGLAQLHQLRGRVGRSDLQSYCFLVSDSNGEIAKKRIECMVSTNDGFEIANKDLEIRGPGELIGLRQHGVPEFKMADLVKHSRILATAQADAKALIKLGGESMLTSDYGIWLSRHLTL